ncbi:hypothetical protein [Streptomyces boninensis]|uniref:hypothetical protein n=1 Tax=Streptomyces boninensis TaxID=2039455 RepID=UPI003B227197
MDRGTILSGLAASGIDTAPQGLAELAAELDIPTADLLVVAGHPVPADFLPPQRDAKVMKQFAYRVSYCDHTQLTALTPYQRPAETALIVASEYPDLS